LLAVAGLHVPVILLVDVVGSTGAVVPEQIGSIASNVGLMLGLTVTSIVVVVAHCPASGVNV
jgi:acetyl-CoA carboxylase alpha subunit